MTVRQWGFQTVTSIVLAAVLAAVLFAFVSSHLQDKARERRLSKLIADVQIEHQTKNPSELLNPKIMKAMKSSEPSSKSDPLRRASSPTGEAQIERR